MINLGILLEGSTSGGGIYQYNLSILNALKSLNTSEYQITVFYFKKDWVSLIPSGFKKVKVYQFKFLRGLGRAYNLIDRTEFGFKRFSWFFNPAVLKMNISNCDLIIFPSQDVLSYKINKRSLTTIHDLMHRYEPQFIEYQDGEYDRREKHFKLISKYASGILVDSNVGKDHVKESYLVSQEKIFVLPFVPPEYLYKTKQIDVFLKYNIPKKYIFYPAQFWEHKNHLNLLKAMKIIIDRGYDINLVLVGSIQNNYNYILHKIKDLKLIDRVFILGYVSDDDMASLYRNAVMTTFVSFLGPTNIPVIESLTLSCPLICSNVYGMPDQVGEAALLIDPKSPKDIASKIQLLLDDESLRLTIARKGLEKIKNYGQQEFDLILKRIIQKVINSQNS